MFLLMFGACSSPTPGTNPDGAGSGTGGAAGTASGSGGNGGNGGNGGSASGSGGSSGTGGSTGSGGSSGSGGRAGSGGASGGSGSGGSGGAPDAGAPRDTAPTDIRVAPAMPTFTTHVAPIIAVKCAPCHTMQAKAGYNWTYDNLVTNSTVTNTNAACGPGEVAEPGLGGNAPRDCKYMEGNGKRVTPGPAFETSLVYLKIMVEDGRLCDQSCGQQMPPTDSGKSLDTYERDIFKNWMKNGAPK
ncbi:MAG TPA: hypothetical protein VFH73_26655 [Polyangia bacterium]|jgi:hypothetical protein|nr:hypothetical protein [Polyangia bacterium]